MSLLHHENNKLFPAEQSLVQNRKSAVFDPGSALLPVVVVASDLDFMTGTPVAEPPPSLVKWSVLALLIYWFIYALLAPVTVWDSHVYNIARLLILQKGGLFGNHIWNVAAQVCYPWSFDVVHYPMLWLGAGYDLPSFVCLLGILVVIQRLVTPRYGEAAAWWCNLALLAMPTLVYQASSTKNDLVGAFCVAVWFYALCLWEERRRRMYLFWMALALAFDAGAKFSGPPVAVALLFYSFWKLRSLPRRQILEFSGLIAVFFLCFGSAETYLNNWLMFKHPFGPPEFIRIQRNTDGLAGGVANFIRYCFGTMSVGVNASPVPEWLTKAGRATLRLVHLHNVGYTSSYNDGSFAVLKQGQESSSDYGPIGALALITALVSCVARSPRDPLWKLSAGGLAAMSVTCMMVGWMPWNNRFLLLPFILFGVAFVIYTLSDGPCAKIRRVLLFLLMIFSAVVYPLHSFNRKPSDLRKALTNREALELIERTAMGEIVNDLEMRIRTDQAAPLLLTAGTNSWTYDILKINNLDVLPVPNLDGAALARVQTKTGASRLLILTLNRPLDPLLASQMTLLMTYTEADSALYQWQRSRAGSESASQPTTPPSVLR